jgi:RNA 2',3'-cyclic 3'-phosphodiesterase
MRIFIAIEITDDLRRACAAAQEHLKAAAGVKWVEPANFHLTLKFLGETDQGTVSRLANELGALAATISPFGLEFAGAGTFPDERRPRVVWVGVRSGLDALFALAQRVEAVCQALGFEPETRAFSAHLTIGRIKLPAPMPALSAGIKDLAQKEFGHMQVDHITVMGSTLMRSGPIYRPLHKLDLKK